MEARYRGVFAQDALRQGLEAERSPAEVDKLQRDLGEKATFSKGGRYVEYPLVSPVTAHPVSDELWEAISPLLPPKPPKFKCGRPRVPDCAALAGIIYVLKSGIPWRMLPKEFGCSGSTSNCATAFWTTERRQPR